MDPRCADLFAHSYTEILAAIIQPQKGENNLSFLFCRHILFPYLFKPYPNRLHETFLGSDPNGTIFQSYPKRVRIADPNGIGSARSRVNAKPIRTTLETDPFGSDPMKTGPKNSPCKD